MEEGVNVAIPTDHQLLPSSECDHRSAAVLLCRFLLSRHQTCKTRLSAAAIIFLYFLSISGEEGCIENERYLGFPFDLSRQFAAHLSTLTVNTKHTLVNATQARAIDAAYYRQ